jgi:uncharacterized cupredoxin-like copper-binding protein
VVRRRLLVIPVLWLAVLCAAVLSSCSAGKTAWSGAPAAQKTVVAKDFKLTLSSAVWPAGDVRVVFENRGPDTHELLMFAADGMADAMPMRLDALTVDEDSARLHNVIDETGTPAGGSQTVTVHLSPGHYVILCNMSGHYMAGMREDVTVA